MADAEPEPEPRPSGGGSMRGGGDGAASRNGIDADADAEADVDYAVRGCTRVANATELGAALREASRASDGTPVRLIGRGSAQRRLPPPSVAAPVQWIRCSGMSAIRRLEPDDLTCSVEPGLPRAILDAELARRGLCWPAPGSAGDGTIGGVCAAGEWAPLAPGAHSARSLLLGLEGVLVGGAPFKCGAAVVKSVAGFDVQKVFVGSRGRLFAATLLHLKLRPRPVHTAHFACAGRERDAALALWRALRLESWPPTAVLLCRERGGGGGFAVRGTWNGQGRLVAELLRRHGLHEVAAPPSLRVDGAAGDELLDMRLRPSRIAASLDLLPAAAPLLVTGSGQTLVRLDRAQSEAVLRRLPELGAVAEVREGAAVRRGRCTPRDAVAQRLEQALRAAFDARGALV